LRVAAGIFTIFLALPPLSPAEGVSVQTRTAATNSCLRQAALLEELSTVYLRTARYAAAEHALLQLIEIHGQISGPDSAVAASAMIRLSRLYRIMGRLSAADGNARRAVEILRRDQAAPGALLADALGALASVGFQNREDPTLIDGLIREAIGIRVKFPEQHAAMVQELMLLGNLQLRQQRFTESEQTLLRAAAILEKTNRSSPRESGILYNNLAQGYKLSGRLAEADDYYRKALSVLETAVGREHPDYALVQVNFADLCRVQRKLGAAAKMYREALAVLSARYDDHNENVAAVKRGLDEVIHDNVWQRQAVLDVRQSKH
jgi:tetratricopeptide (TPR) repeat protein